MEIAFRSLEADDLPEIRGWFADAELSRRMSYPTDEWFAYVSVGDAARCWLAVDAGMIIGEVQVDREKTGRGYIDLAVRPDLRGRGLGVAVLSAFLAGPGRIYRVLEGRIEPDNAASLTCCRRCGFVVLPEADADGFLQAVYRQPQDP